MIDRRLNYGRHHIQRFLEMARPYNTVLDLGAGHGDDLELAASVSPGSRCLAVEAFPPYAEKLKDKGVGVLPLDIEHAALPFRDGEIDVVVANQVLEHTKEIFWIFHQVSRVLPLGGKFIVGVPNLASLHNRILLCLGRQPTSIKTASAHVRGFTKRDLLRFIEEVFPGGYTLVAFGGSNFYPFPAALARPIATLFPGMAWGIFMMLEKRRTYTREFLDFPAGNRLETNFYVGDA